MQSKYKLYVNINSITQIFIYNHIDEMGPKVKGQGHES